MDPVAQRPVEARKAAHAQKATSLTRWWRARWSNTWRIPTFSSRQRPGSSRRGDPSFSPLSTELPGEHGVRGTKKGTGQIPNLLPYRLRSTEIDSKESIPGLLKKFTNSGSGNRGFEYWEAQSSFWLPRILSSYMDMQARTGDIVLT